MEEIQNRVVKDFFRGLKIFGMTIVYGFIITIITIWLVSEFSADKELGNFIFKYGILPIVPIAIILGILGFIVNYTPVRVKGDIVSIPASDQIRTFLDVLILNPITGLYRKRTYNINEIENVANGYTKILKGKEREWNVVISGLKNGKSFSQRIDCSNKQVRDEVRNTLKQTIKGNVNADFAI